MKMHSLLGGKNLKHAQYKNDKHLYETVVGDEILVWNNATGNMGCGSVWIVEEINSYTSKLFDYKIKNVKFPQLTTRGFILKKDQSNKYDEWVDDGYTMISRNRADNTISLIVGVDEKKFIEAFNKFGKGNLKI